MSSSIVLRLGILFISVLANTHEDFNFENSVKFDDEFGGSSTDRIAPNQNLEAPVGKIFYFNISKSYSPSSTILTAKLQDGKSLPHWLLFDKVDGVFWGIPLNKDLGNITVVIKNMKKDKILRKINIDVTPSILSFNALNNCSSSGYNTLLNLLIDKKVETITPKRRIIAIYNIAKFFGIPYSAFMLKSSNKKIDDNENISVFLAGPGNVITKASSSASSIEVPVGCDGHLFHHMIPLVHQLKRQAIDGTISEVLGLPVFGWRVQISNGKALREKRQAPDFGSGDYDGEYYDDYEDETEEYNQEDKSEIPVESTSHRVITTSVLAVTQYANTSIHPHRHHHGENKQNEIIPVVQENSANIDNVVTTPTSFQVHKDQSTALESTTSETKSTSKSSSPHTTTTIVSTIIPKNSPSTSTMKQEFPLIPIATEVDDYGDYKTEDYDEEDNEDDPSEIESQTFVPILQTSKSEVVEILSTTTPSTTTSTQAVTDKETTSYEEVITGQEISLITTLPEYKNESVTQNIAESETTVSTITNFINVISTTTGHLTTTETTTSITRPATSLTTTYSEASTSSVTRSEQLSTPTTIIVVEETEFTTPTRLTTLRHIPSTTSQSITTEEEEDTKNYPPYIENRLKRKNVIAGKVFRFVIPDDTFKDSEDNYDLKLEFLDSDENPIILNSWCQFNPARREIYGLPLDDHVSKWEYIVRATDKAGASVQDRLTILVQQHKLQRVFNHEFSLEIHIEKKDEFRHYIDWSLKTLRALGRIYNTNMSEITVRKVNYNNQFVTFTWSNDSLPTNYCPKTEIEKLFKILTANDRGDPSREINAAVSPELRVKKVFYHGIGVCEELNTPIAPPVNYPPILRNPVNHINATVGELLIFRVPKDTFYDPEDLDTLSLNLTLLTADRQIIPSQNWLQFDSKNREFFGIPRKTSRSEYQLVCIDSGGLPVIDSLEIVVYPALRVDYNVEFSMTIETAYDKFINSAVLQKKFVEKLTEIFNDKNSNYIHFLPFKQKQHSTIATWYNKSLNTEKCPHAQIANLESMMKNDERGISNRVHSIMEPDFQVSTIKVLPTSNCKVHKPKYHHVPKVPEDKITTDESTQITSSSDEYLLTFIIPIVVIIIMTLFAALAACALYRRKRTGKMNVVEEGRSNYGNKGIPVIFQEELDEKPEAGTKVPVILKDEKPPLAPPEYSKSGSLKFRDEAEPYHPPPPPFTKAQDNAKPKHKPAPTYRKPPPYVPP